MSRNSYTNDAGEPMMTAAQARTEAEIDAHAAWADRGLDDSHAAERREAEYEARMDELCACPECGADRDHPNDRCDACGYPGCHKRRDGGASC
jgi:uncharacterized paraquat-inducible protein A